ncbi:unnamed protein product [Prorocentrum cordatum]|uniref:Uncharacterized protein n=2 Tax=Prorocentrum cordatum TaxID=2364126 RepID=A0ABN9U7J3_9DINO|nr:unnamed protein product [Polarella glacialis]
MAAFVPSAAAASPAAQPLRAVPLGSAAPAAAAPARAGPMAAFVPSAAAASPAAQPLRAVPLGSAAPAAAAGARAPGGGARTSGGKARGGMSAVGVTAPLGYFDPLGFCQVGDYAGFHKLRSSELKHGRVAMMAAFGTAFQHFVKLPGFEQTPAGLGALTDPTGVLGFTCLILPIAAFTESVYWKDDDLSKEPGNFGDPGDWAGLFGAFGGGYSDEIRNKELNNGRMGMISVMGILLAEIATGKDGIQQFGL